MSESMTGVNVRGLLTSLGGAGLLGASESRGVEAFIVSNQKERPLPLYLAIFLAIGAFAAGGFFIGCLSVLEIIDFNSKRSLVSWGLLFVGVALFLIKVSGGKRNTFKHCFFTQGSFCSMCIGKILFVMGMSEIFGRGTTWGIPLSMLVITTATYSIYRVTLDRFLSCLGILAALFFNIIFERSLWVSIEFLLNLFFFTQLVFSGFFFTHGRIKRDYLPIVYALVCSLCLTALFFSMQPKMGYGASHFCSPNFINAVLVFSLLGLMGWAAGGLSKLKTEPLLFASIGTVLLGIISVPGVILSISLMVLGHAKHEKALLILGMLFIPLFIFLYYHSLNVTLMMKAAILVGSGLLLLSARAYLALKKWDLEG